MYAYLREDRIVELQIGRIVSHFADACSVYHFNPAYASFTTLTSQLIAASKRSHSLIQSLCLFVQLLTTTPKNVHSRDCTRYEQKYHFTTSMTKAAGSESATLPFLA